MRNHKKIKDMANVLSGEFTCYLPSSFIGKMFDHLVNHQYTPYSYISMVSFADFENLGKAFEKAKKVVEKEGTPRFYIRALVELEDFVAVVRFINLQNSSILVLFFKQLPILSIPSSVPRHRVACYRFGRIVRVANP